MKIIRHATSIALCLIAIAFAVLLVHLSTTADEFGRYNLDWNGTSTFFDAFERHEVTTIPDPARLAGYTNSTLLVVAPDINFTGTDLRYYRDYVMRGNTLVLADDFNKGNALLQGLGSSMEILPGDLASVDRAYNSPSLVVAYPAEPSVMAPLNRSMVFDRAAAISGGESRISTSLISWREENGSITVGGEKLLDRYAVAAHETLGKGDLYVISDPSIFINGMQSVDTDYATPAYIRTLAGVNKKILIDTYSSRSFQVSGIREIFQEIQTRTEYKVIIAAAILGVIGLAWRRKLTQGK